MRRVFLDTFYLMALLLPYDQWHAMAIEWETRIHDSIHFVTTHEILTEFLASVVAAGAYFRGRAVGTIEQMRRDPRVTIIPPSLDLFDRGLERYRRRPDKEYSLTDCISMVVMEDEGITEALTHDHHFEQEGFVILIP